MKINDKKSLKKNKKRYVLFTYLSKLNLQLC